ncbi:MAG: glycoside hydrolase family 20 zincin-like fold domain-containing protein, partial [Bacteroidota bacterium]
MNARFATILALLVIAAASQGRAQRSILTLMPRPKAAFQRPGQFVLSNETVLLIPDMPDFPGPYQDDYLLRQIRERFGLTLNTVRMVDFPSTYLGKSAIVITSANPHDRPLFQIPPGETIPDSAGYVLNISPDRIAISSRGREGAYNAIATLMQLINNNGGVISAGCAHIYDYPDYPNRWVFSQHNLRG